MTEPERVTPEFSRPLAADSVGTQPVERRIEAGCVQRYCNLACEHAIKIIQDGLRR